METPEQTPLRRQPKAARTRRPRACISFSCNLLLILLGIIAAAERRFGYYNTVPPMLDVSRADLVAGVAGSGTMGRGIVQVLAQSGVRTLVFDAQAGAAGKA